MLGKIALIFELLRQRPQQLRKAFFRTAIVVPALVSMSLTGVAAEEKDDALTFAIDLCIQPSGDGVEFKESLTSHGWIESSDETGLLLLVGSNIFSYSHSLDTKEQVEASIHRAISFAPQVIFETGSSENTALFHSGENTLGVVGLFMDDPELPFCILGGPEATGKIISEIVPLLPAPIEEASRWKSTVLFALEGRVATSKVTVTKTDVQKVQAAVQSFGISELPIKALSLSDVLAAYRPVNISIQRISSSEGE